MAKPVVCFRTPAIEEMVYSGVDSVLVATGDTDALFNGVVDLLLSEGLRDQIGSAARDAVLERFDAQSQAEYAVDRVYGAVPGWLRRRRATQEVGV
jgi:glycosyltransferase involved in cell wall biosynthesis